MKVASLCLMLLVVGCTHGTPNGYHLVCTQVDAQGKQWTSFKSVPYAGLYQGSDGVWSVNGGEAQWTPRPGETCTRVAAYTKENSK